MTAEHVRLEEAREQQVPWKKWGPYLSERQWGTVREDYSEGGDAWNYFSHDQARSRAYRWGEDGLAGISDDQQRLCFALALWNGKDPILKERLFGLTNSESNHGEDVKEYYFYLDSTPTHSYMKYLYKYPQAAFPYADLVETSRGRSRHEFEYELLDTGVFDQDRYFDVFVEYAKESPEDILIQITRPQPRPGAGRAARPADALVPQPVVLARQPPSGRPCSRSAGTPGSVVRAVDPALGERYLYCEGDAPLLFTENETNTQRIFGVPNRTPYVKDSINDYVVHGRQEAVNPEKKGTKAAAHYRLTVGPGECQVVRLRLSDVAPADCRQGNGKPTGPSAAASTRCSRPAAQEADEFYAAVIPRVARRRRGQRHAPGPGGDALEQAVLPLRRGQVAGGARLRPVQGDAQGRAAQRPLAPHVQRRRHLHAGQVGVPLVRRLGPGLPRARPDARGPGFRQAATQADAARALHAPQRPDPGLRVELRRRQPAGPCLVHHLHLPPGKGAERARATGTGSRACFQKLLLNFTWWVNRKDRSGRNVFEGGFLGLDNIGVFDRSAPLPTGGYLEQADGTAWMALFCQNMLRDRRRAGA